MSVAFSSVLPGRLAAADAADTLNRFMVPDFVVATRTSRIISVQVTGQRARTGVMRGFRRLCSGQPCSQSQPLPPQTCAQHTVCNVYQDAKTVILFRPRTPPTQYPDGVPP